MRNFHEIKHRCLGRILAQVMAKSYFSVMPSSVCPRRARPTICVICLPV
jgi:hypothetical protein